LKRFILIAALVLSACMPEGTPQPGQHYLSGNEYADETVGFLQNVDPQYPRPDVTYASASYLYGIQVEYFAADGTSYLWFRGNQAPLRGEWRVEGTGLTANLCFKYGANTRDAVTGTPGGNWECRRLRNEREGVVSFLDGDPFRLSRGQLPQMSLRRCQLPPPMRLMTQSFQCL